MPWEIRTKDGKSCVYKEGTDELEGCHESRADAVEHMQALYATEGVNKSLIEIEKCYYEPPYYYTATSFEQAEKIEEALHRQHEIREVFHRYLNIAENILYSVEIEDKVGALDNLNRELADRIEEESEGEMEDMQKSNGVDKAVGLFKSDDEKRLVYGVVLNPGVVDSQGDIADEGTIEKAAHEFFRKSRIMDYQHEQDLPENVAVPVESYIAPATFKIGDKLIRKGAWVMVTHVPDEVIWNEIKKGQILSYSIKGVGRRTPLEAELAEA